MKKLSEIEGINDIIPKIDCVYEKFLEQCLFYEPKIFYSKFSTLDWHEYAGIFGNFPELQEFLFLTQIGFEKKTEKFVFVRYYKFHDCEELSLLKESISNNIRTV